MSGRKSGWVRSVSGALAALCLVGIENVRGAGIVTFGDDPTNHDSTSVPARPGYLQSYEDPDFHSTVTRVSDSTSAVDGSTNSSHGVEWGNTVRNHYRTIQPWNADMSLILIQNESFDASGTSCPGPKPKRLILDGETYAFKFGLPLELFDCRWHPTNPDILFYTVKNRLVEYDVSKRLSTLVHAFTKYPSVDGAISINNSNLSADGRWLVLSANYGKGRDFVMYDTTALAPRDGTTSLVNFPREWIDPQTGKPRTDRVHPWATVSPLGDYVVMFWEDSLSQVYDRSFHFLRTLTPSGMSHYDVVNDNGAEYVVGVHKNPGSGGFLYRSSLADITCDRLVADGFAAGTSARNGVYPGWVYSTYGRNTARFPFSDEIVATDVNSTHSSTSRRLAHCFNTRVDYVSEVHAVPSPDGRRVLFQSNWANRGGNGRGTDTYIVDLRRLLISSGEGERTRVRP